MGVSISGKGVLSGLASLVAGVVNNFNLLITRIIGYTNTGGGGSSYYTTMVGSTGPGYVAGGYGSVLAHSLDGIDWSPSTLLGAEGSWLFPNSFNYANGKFVSALGDGSAYSTDGVTWQYDPNGPGLRIVYGRSSSNQYHFVGIEQEAIKTSVDGITWSNASVSGNPTIELLNFLTLLPREWTTTDLYFISDSYRNDLYRSTDGLSWTKSVNANGLRDFAICSQGSFQGRIVASNGGYKTFYSVDNGDTWTESQTELIGVGGGIQEVIYSPYNGMFFATTQSHVYYSADGSSWTSFYSTPENSYLRYIADGGEKGIVFSRQFNSDVFFIHTKNFTNDFQEYERVLSAYFSGQKVMFLNNNFIHVTTDISAISSDGINWTESSSISGSYVLAGEGILNTLVETQVSIGNQGEEGAEILAPVDVYTVPANKTANIDEVRVKNTSANTITYDLGVLNTGVELTDINALINDQSISAGATATITNISSPLTAGQRIVVLPSAVDVVEVKVYGTES